LITDVTLYQQEWRPTFTRERSKVRSLSSATYRSGIFQTKRPARVSPADLLDRVAHGQSHAPAKTNFANRFKLITLSSPDAKNIPVSFFQKS
jgi:hypothetical protein